MVADYAIVVYMVEESGFWVARGLVSGTGRYRKAREVEVSGGGILVVEVESDSADMIDRLLCRTYLLQERLLADRACESFKSVSSQAGVVA